MHWHNWVCAWCAVAYLVSALVELSWHRPGHALLYVALAIFAIGVLRMPSRDVIRLPRRQ